MKILLCTKCSQIFNLGHDYRECLGGHGGGQYIDSLNAKIWGNPTEIFVLGFANNSLVNAIRDQINLGDQSPEYMPGYGMTPRGREFTAFVIPDAAKSVIRVPDRFEPIEAQVLSQTRGRSA